MSLFGTDQRITSGPAATRLHSKAEYMTAPERFADSQIPLAPRAPSIHDLKAFNLAHKTFTDIDALDAAIHSAVADLNTERNRDLLGNSPPSATVESRIERADKIETERRSYISSRALSAKAFAEAVRGHWAIENNLHWSL